MKNFSKIFLKGILSLTIVLSVFFVFQEAEAEDPDFGNNSGSSYSINIGDAPLSGYMGTSDEDWFQFTVSSAPIDIMIDINTDPDLTLHLIDTDGTTQLAEDDDGGPNGERIGYSITSNGTYFIRLKPYSTGTGNYTIELTELVDDHANAYDESPTSVTVDGPTVQGVMENGGDVDWFTFTTTQNQTLSISLLDSMAGEYIYLYESDGTTLVGSTDNYNNMGDMEHTLSAGTYFIKVEPYYAEYTGTYSVYVGQDRANTYNSTNPAPEEISIEGALSGIMNNETDQDWFTLTITEEAYLEVSISNIGHNISLFESDGSTMIETRNTLYESGTMEQIFLPGTYFVKVDPAYSSYLQPYEIQIGEILWTPIGPEGLFDPGDEDVEDKKIITSGSDVYIGYMTAGTFYFRKYDSETNEWNLAETNLTKTDIGDFDIEVAPNGDIYLFTSDYNYSGNIQILPSGSTVWIAGPNFSASTEVGNNFDMIIGDSGEIYILYEDYYLYEGIIEKYEGGSWTQLGANQLQMGSSSLFHNGSNIYLGYWNYYNAEVGIKKFNEENDNWEIVSTVSSNNPHFKFVVDSSGNIYLSRLSGGDITFYVDQGSGLSVSQNFSTIYSQDMIIDDTDRVYLSFVSDETADSDGYRKAYLLYTEDGGVTFTDFTTKQIASNDIGDIITGITHHDTNYVSITKNNEGDMFLGYTKDDTPYMASVKKYKRKEEGMTFPSTLTLADTNPSTSPGLTTINFTAPFEIPSGGSISLAIPEEFSVDDIADATNNISSFIVDESGVNISSASVTSHVLTITMDSTIASGSNVSIALDNNPETENAIIDANPENREEYDFIITIDDGISQSISSTEKIDISISEGVKATSITLENKTPQKDAESFSLALVNNVAIDNTNGTSYIEIDIPQEYTPTGNFTGFTMQVDDGLAPSPFNGFTTPTLTGNTIRIELTENINTSRYIELNFPTGVLGANPEGGDYDFSITLYSGFINEIFTDTITSSVYGGYHFIPKIRETTLTSFENSGIKFGGEEVFYEFSMTSNTGIFKTNIDGDSYHELIDASFSCGSANYNSYYGGFNRGTASQKINDSYFIALSADSGQEGVVVAKIVDGSEGSGILAPEETDPNAHYFLRETLASGYDDDLSAIGIESIGDLSTHDYLVAYRSNTSGTVDVTLATVRANISETPSISLVGNTKKAYVDFCGGRNCTDSPNYLKKLNSTHAIMIGDESARIIEIDVQESNSNITVGTPISLPQNTPGAQMNIEKVEVLDETHVAVYNRSVSSTDQMIIYLLSLDLNTNTITTGTPFVAMDEQYLEYDTKIVDDKHAIFLDINNAELSLLEFDHENGIVTKNSTIPSTINKLYSTEDGGYFSTTDEDDLQGIEVDTSTNTIELGNKYSGILSETIDTRPVEIIPVPGSKNEFIYIYRGFSGSNEVLKANYFQYTDNWIVSGEYNVSSEINTEQIGELPEEEKISTSPFNICYGIARLPDNAHTAVLNKNHIIDLTDSGGATNTTNSQTIEGVLTDVKSAMEEISGESITSIKKLEFQKGDGASTNNIVLKVPSETFTPHQVEIPDATNMFFPDDFDGKFTPPIKTTKGPDGARVEKAIKIGIEEQTILLDKPAKVILNTTIGTPKFGVGDRFSDIDECTDATINSAGSLAFPGECHFKENGNTYIWTWHFTTFGSYSPTTNVTAKPSNPPPCENPGSVEINFKPGSAIPSNGGFEISFPDEFTVATSMTSANIEFFLDDGTDVFGIIKNVSISKPNTIKIDINSQIDAESIVKIKFDPTFIVQTPCKTGQYSFSIYTYTTTSIPNPGPGPDPIITTSPISTNPGYINVGGSGVEFTATVLEALILTIQDTAINLVVNPSVNDGKDQSQKTTLMVKTNAQNYSIYAKLENSKGNASGLHYNDGIQDYYIANGWDANDGPNNDGENIFGYNTIAAGEGIASFSDSPTPIFNNQTGLTNSATHNIFYDLDVDFLTPSGVYEGVITYTATPTF